MARMASLQPLPCRNDVPVMSASTRQSCSRALHAPPGAMIWCAAEEAKICWGLKVVMAAERNQRTVYASAGWEIDLARRELRSRGAPVPLGSRAFEIVA